MSPLWRTAPLAAALAAVAVIAAPASAALHASDFESALPTRAVAASAGTWVTLPARRAPNPFNLLGLRWRGGPAHAMARVRRSGHRWSAWLALDAVGTGHHGMTVSEPLWSATATRYQVRFSLPVSRARVHFVRVSGRTRARARQADAVTPAGAPQPAIIPRADWNQGNQCPPRASPLYGRVDLAMVHDTVTANDYAPTDSAGIVLAICRYHRNSNGWNDIGYNFLVDRYGQVFEGRGGGIDQAVVGAQAQGYNSFSTGISNIGTYDAVPLPDVALQSLSRLIAWKLTLHGAPTQGTIPEITTGGPLNRYPAGTTVILNRISGHRDGDATDCPGNALYAQLPQIRAVAGGLAGDFHPPARLLATPLTRTVAFPAPAGLSGVLTLADGTHAPGTSVLIQRRSRTTWITIGTAPLATDGAWQAAVPLAWSRVLRAYWPGDATHPPVASGGYAFTIVPQITARAARTHVRAGRSAVLTGRVAPHKRRLSLTLAQRSRAVYRTIAVLGVGTANGGYRTVVRLRRRGLYRFTVSSRADSHNAAAQAPAVFVRVLRAAPRH